ncbi:hypothetical protein [Thermus thermamylovorans]|uniref:hypothetical protein n=1 Tax=Thermus thermamylovorans TaxID=2509362 RepID=UPI00191C40F5
MLGVALQSTFRFWRENPSRARGTPVIALSALVLAGTSSLNRLGVVGVEEPSTPSWLAPRRGPQRGHGHAALALADGPTFTCGYLGRALGVSLLYLGVVLVDRGKRLSEVQE